MNTIRRIPDGAHATLKHVANAAKNEKSIVVSKEIQKTAFKRRNDRLCVTACCTKKKKGSEIRHATMRSVKNITNSGSSVNSCHVCRALSILYIVIQIGLFIYIRTEFHAPPVRPSTLINPVQVLTEGIYEVDGSESLIAAKRYTILLSTYLNAIVKFGSDNIILYSKDFMQFLRAWILVTEYDSTCCKNVNDEYFISPHSLCQGTNEENLIDGFTPAADEMCRRYETTETVDYKFVSQAHLTKKQLPEGRKILTRPCWTNMACFQMHEKTCKKLKGKIMEADFCTQVNVEQQVMGMIVSKNRQLMTIVRMLIYPHIPVMVTNMVIFSLMIVSGVLNSIRLLVTAPTAILLFALGGIVGGMVAEIFNPATLLQGSIYGLSLLIGVDSGFGIFYAIIRKKRNPKSGKINLGNHLQRFIIDILFMVIAALFNLNEPVGAVASMLLGVTMSPLIMVKAPKSLKAFSGLITVITIGAIATINLMGIRCDFKIAVGHIHKTAGVFDKPSFLGLDFQVITESNSLNPSMTAASIQEFVTAAKTGTSGDYCQLAREYKRPHFFDPSLQEELDILCGYQSNPHQAPTNEEVSS